MDWDQIIQAIGGTAVIVGAFAWVAKYLIEQFFTRGLERSKLELEAEHDQQLADLKHQQAVELEQLRIGQQNALAEMQAEADRRLEHVKSALGRVERLEADLARSRGEGYGEIWQLTGSLNLFGPTTKVNIKDLSNRLKDWYFEHGWVLSQAAKQRYFLVQEILSYGDLRSATFERPADETLYGDSRHPVQRLRDLRSQLLGDTAHRDDIADMEAWVSAWKTKDTEPDENWVLLQLVMSRFRSRIVKELFSGQAMHKHRGSGPLDRG